MAAKEKEIARLKDEMMRQRIDEAIKGAARKDGAKVVSMFVPGGSAEDLRKATDIIRDKLKSCVVVVGAGDETRGLSWPPSRKTSRRLQRGTDRQVDRGEVRRQGGGNPQMAQGGVPADPAIEALSHVKSCWPSDVINSPVSGGVYRRSLIK